VREHEIDEILIATPVGRMVFFFWFAVPGVFEFMYVTLKMLLKSGRGNNIYAPFFKISLEKFILSDHTVY